MSTDSQQPKSAGQLLSLAFTSLFVLHGIALPVWIAVEAMMIMESEDIFFLIFPGWLIGTAIFCFTLIVIVGMNSDYDK